MQMQRLEELKVTLRKLGADTMIHSLPAKVAELEMLAADASVSMALLRDEAFALVEMAHALHNWLALSQSAVHEGDFMTSLINNLKRTLLHVSASGAGLINSLAPSLEQQGDMRVAQLKKATTAEQRNAFELAHKVRGRLGGSFVHS